MKETVIPSFEAYLDAKRALDERSAHGPTWRGYLDILRAGAYPASPSRSVLELGCGLGAMLDRTLRDLDQDRDLDQERGSGPRSGPGFRLSYLAVDTEPDRLAALSSRFKEARPDGGRSEKREGVELELETRAADALEELDRLAREGRRFDAVVSHAFADLVGIRLLSAAAAAVLTPGGAFYNSQVFDGITAFIPASPREVEEDGRYIAAYHRSMRRDPDGETGPDGASGRLLLAHLSRSPWRLVSAGPSDWVIPPGADRKDSDDRTVIAAMLGFFERSVGSELSATRPGDAGSTDSGPYDGGLYDGDWQAAADREDFETWLYGKRERLARGELGLYAHNLDVLAVRGEQDER